jgi:hypothetical protein
MHFPQIVQERSITKKLSAHDPDKEYEWIKQHCLSADQWTGLRLPKDNAYSPGSVPLIQTQVINTDFQLIHGQGLNCKLALRIEIYKHVGMARVVLALTGRRAAAKHPVLPLNHRWMKPVCTCKECQLSRVVPALTGRGAAGTHPVRRPVHCTHEKNGM